MAKSNLPNARSANIDWQFLLSIEIGE